MDKRTTPFSGRVAHVSLQGEVAAQFTEGEFGQIIVPVTNLLDKPGGERCRQLLLGSNVLMVDRDQDHVFVQSLRDGYCGWIREDSVGNAPEVTHWVTAPATHLYAEPLVQAPEKQSLSLGSRITVSGSWGAWANTPLGYIPMCHIHPLDYKVPDAVAVAESLVGTPYLWGGNSRFGIDCSGLVQAAFHAAGRHCPGDSDMQISMGRGLAPNEPSRRGDLIFWRGHVAIVVNETQLIHANGHTMSVSYENIRDAIARISAGGGGLVLARQRVL